MAHTGIIKSIMYKTSLGALQYKCTNGSRTTTVPLQRLQTYLNQPVHKNTCSLPKAHTSSHFTLLQVLEAPTNSTPSTVECRVLGHLTHRMMTSSCVHSSANTNTLPMVRYAAGTKPNKTVTKIGLGPKIVGADHLWLPKLVPLAITSLG